MPDPVLVEAPASIHAKDISRLLYNIFLALIGRGPVGASLPVTVQSSAGTQRTTTTTLATGNGTVAAGSKSVMFGISSDFEGTINGAAVDAAEFASLPFICPDPDTLAAIPYTISAGSLLINRIE